MSWQDPTCVSMIQEWAEVFSGLADTVEVWITEELLWLSLWPVLGSRHSSEGCFLKCSWFGRCNPEALWSLATERPRFTLLIPSDLLLDFDCYLTGMLGLYSRNIRLDPFPVLWGRNLNIFISTDTCSKLPGYHSWVMGGGQMQKDCAEAGLLTSSWGILSLRLCFLLRLVPQVLYRGVNM